MNVKRLSLPSAIFILILANAMVQGQSDAPVPQKQAELNTWKRYTVAGEQFSVTLPTVPAMATTIVDLEKLRTTRRQRMLGAYADGAVYTVYVQQNPERQSLEDFVAEYRQNGARDSSTERIVTINDIKGKEYSWRDKTTSRVTQFFAFYGCLFVFSAGGDDVDDAHMEQFFSSIVLSPHVDGITVADGIGVPFPPPDNEQPFTGKEVDRRARLMMKPEPSYTEMARQKLTTGTVVLRAVFSSSGSVDKIRVLVELPNGLTERAIEAAKKIKFIPAVKDGKYVGTWIQLEYNFNLY